MATNEDPTSSTWDSTQTTTERLLTKWKQCLLFGIVSEIDNTTPNKVVGIIDGGSRYCLMSYRTAKSSGLEIMPFEGGSRPVLEGLEDILNCQPVGWVLAKIRQADLKLDTGRWRFLVIPSHKIDLLLGRLFNHELDIEVKISKAVKMGIDPEDCDNDHCPGHNVHVLIDSRSNGRRRREHEEKRRQAAEATGTVWLAIREIKKSKEQGSSTEDSTRNVDFQPNQSSSNSHQSTATLSSSSTWEVLASQSSTNTSSYLDSSATSTVSSPWTILTSPDTASTSDPNSPSRKVEHTGTKK
ncbi:hypothetical protein F5Y06DRAFT_306614 [Hypoxylon sp. FL0890]|nr:hypothetical protein F5Y06DRAFT_306614 [Hypoxylon sp. FL0890]